MTDRKASKPQAREKPELEDLEVSKETIEDLMEPAQEAVRGGRPPDKPYTGTVVCPTALCGP